MKNLESEEVDQNVRHHLSSLLIAGFGLLFDLTTGLLYNHYYPEEWACNAYFLGDAVAAFSYSLALWKMKNHWIFALMMSLYGMKLFDELFGDPTDTGWIRYLVVIFIVIEVKLDVSNRIKKWIYNKWKS